MSWWGRSTFLRGNERRDHQGPGGQRDRAGREGAHRRFSLRASPLAQSKALHTSRHQSLTSPAVSSCVLITSGVSRLRQHAAQGTQGTQGTQDTRHRAQGRKNEPSLLCRGCFIKKVMQVRSARVYPGQGWAQLGRGCWRLASCAPRPRGEFFCDQAVKSSAGGGKTPRLSSLARESPA